MLVERLSNKYQEIWFGDLVIFVSYDIPIAFKFQNDIVICENHWSNTTQKHINASIRKYYSQDKEKEIKRTRELPENQFRILLKLTIQTQATLINRNDLTAELDKKATEIYREMLQSCVG